MRVRPLSSLVRRARSINSYTYVGDTTSGVNNDFFPLFPTLLVVPPRTFKLGWCLSNAITSGVYSGRSSSTSLKSSPGLDIRCPPDGERFLSRGGPNEDPYPVQQSEWECKLLQCAASFFRSSLGVYSF